MTEVSQLVIAKQSRLCPRKDPGLLRYARSDGGRRALADKPPNPQACALIRLQQRHRMQRVSVKTEGDNAGEKQRSPGRDQEKRKHYWKPLVFVTNDEDHNR